MCNLMNYNSQSDWQGYSARALNLGILSGLGKYFNNCLARQGQDGALGDAPQRLIWKKTNTQLGMQSRLVLSSPLGIGQM